MYDSTTVSGVRVLVGRFSMYDNASVRNGDGVQVMGNFWLPDWVEILGGTFTMYDNATISGNTAWQQQGSGVRILDGGIFRMAGGIIYGRNASAVLRNTVLIYSDFADENGAVLYVDSGAVAATWGGSDGTANSFGRGRISINTIQQIQSGTPTQGRPAAPTNVRVDRSPATAIISWNAVPNVTDYWVYRSTRASGPFSLIGITSPAERHFIDGPLSTSTPTYYYRVSARNSFGSSESSTISAPVWAIDRFIATPLSASNCIVIEWPIDNTAYFAVGAEGVGSFITGFLAPIKHKVDYAYIVEYLDGFNNWVRLGKFDIPVNYFGVPTRTGRYYVVDRNLQRGRTYHYRIYAEVKQKFFGITVQTRRTASYQVSATIP
jgi:hypothetical protein